MILTKGQLGIKFPGILSADNKRFSLNIIKWLTGDTLPAIDLASKGFDLIDKIERTLVQFIMNELQKNYHNNYWGKGVPENIRIKCATRREQENTSLPPQCYFDLLDIKEIIEKKWKIFEENFNKAGLSGGKKEALSWFMTLNGIRKNVMHPARRQTIPGLITNDDIDWLNSLLGYIRQLLGAPDPSHIH